MRAAQKAATWLTYVIMDQKQWELYQQPTGPDKYLQPQFSRPLRQEIVFVALPEEIVAFWKGETIY